MLEYQGKYASCIVYTDAIEEEAVAQIYAYLNCPASEGTHPRFMPDIHAGKGCVIGFTAGLTDKIIPNLIGVDIGCGVLSINLGNIDIDFQQIDDFIREKIPSGCRINQTSKMSSYIKKQVELIVENTVAKTGQDLDYVIGSMGSLGGGNHYWEIGIDEEENKWLTVHSGSRNFGLKIALYHQRIAKEKNPFGDLSWLEKEDAVSYISDMKIAQIFAAENRYQMIRKIIAEVIPVKHNNNQPPIIESVHNYINFEDNTIRKGAISAQKDQYCVIPWNMRDGMIIGKGKGNPDWNYSAPHGAGRVMGRNQAKRTLSLEGFTEEMKGIWTSSVGLSTLDEAPGAYKDHNEIEKYLSETVEIVHRVKPLYNFKSSE